MITSEHKLSARLNQLTFDKSLIFTVCCCERMLPNFEAFAVDAKLKNSHVLRDIVDRIWELVAVKLDKLDFSKPIKELNKLHIDDDENDSVFTHLAQDTVSAVLNVLQMCVTGDHNLALRVAKSALDSIDDYLQTVNTPFTDNFPDEVIPTEWIVDAPLFRHEIRAQERDLSMLESLQTIDGIAVSKIRKLSQGSGIQPIERGLVRKRT
jgi:uncharacterized protein